MKEKKEVIKHSAAIHIQNNITLLQRRAWNVLLANAYDELPTKERHSIKVKSLMKVLEFGSHNEEYLKEALRALLTCKVEWNVLEKDRERDWLATTLLAEARITKGVCSYAYAPTLREGLHNPRMYARLSLSMQNKFDSKHAQALWELCVDALDEARRYGETPFLLLEKYREFMGIGEDMYPLFKLFNQRVIKEPIQEINRVTDFHVEVGYKREGRRVTAVKFKVRRMMRLPGQITRQGELWPEIKDMPPAVMELKNAGLAADEAWKIWQQGFDYVELDKRPANVGDNPEAAFDKYVMEKVHLLKRRQAEGKIKNITGFLREALKKNYANPEFAAEEKQKEARERGRIKQASERERQKLEEQKAELKKARDQNIHQLCEQIVKESPVILEEVMDVVFKENPDFKKLYQSGKTLLRNYQERMMFWVIVDQHLVKRYPERFQAVQDSYATSLAALEQEMAA